MLDNIQSNEAPPNFLGLKAHKCLVASYVARSNRLPAPENFWIENSSPNCYHVLDKIRDNNAAMANFLGTKAHQYLFVRHTAKSDRLPAPDFFLDRGNYPPNCDHVLDEIRKKKAATANFLRTKAHKRLVMSHIAKLDHTPVGNHKIFRGQHPKINLSWFNTNVVMRPTKYSDR